MKLQDFINNYGEDKLYASYQTDYASYRHYWRLIKNVEEMQKKGIASKNFIDNIHQEALGKRDTQEEQNNVINDQQCTNNKETQQIDNENVEQQCTNNKEMQQLDNESAEEQLHDIDYYDQGQMRFLKRQSFEESDHHQATLEHFGCAKNVIAT
eukprot:15365798-Ditylum_brightwellii.AAC.1